MKSAMDYAENMLSKSEFLRTHCKDVNDYRDPEDPMPTLLLASFGLQMAAHFEQISSAEWNVLVRLIEEGVSNEDKDVGEAVATGLLEAMVNYAEATEGLWPEIEARLGPEALDYADAYRKADYLALALPNLKDKF